jgi:hypothetical protein
MATDKFGIKKLYPSKIGGRKWYNDSWYNGKVRVIGQNLFDPYDSRVGAKAGDIRVNGDGTATAAPSDLPFRRGQRTYVIGPWRNTEMTVYLRNRGSMPSIQMRSRSNHDGPAGLPYGFSVSIDGHDTSCGFGNYLVKWSDQNDNKVMCEVEIFHPLYKRALDKHDSLLPPVNEWTGYKQITRDNGTSKVRVEGWILRDADNASQSAWFKDTQFTFDRAAPLGVDVTGLEASVEYCKDKGDRTATNPDKYIVWRNSGKWCYVRFEGLDLGVSDIDLKFFSVREIVPQL